MKQLAILRSASFIGYSTLDVIRYNPEEFYVATLVTGKNVARVIQQCLESTPRYAVMNDEKSTAQVKTALLAQGDHTEVMSRQQAACDMAALDDANQVMAAIVGVAGLLLALVTIRVSKSILLTDKESPVTCGRLLMDDVERHKAQLLPVDSEYNAIFQSLP